MPVPTRPELTADLTGAELRRWYWTLAELTTLARRLGIPTSGGKIALTARLVAVLDGTEPPPSPRTPRTASHQLAPPLDRESVIPSGQRCSQVLRAFLRTEIGSACTFDAHMRDFVAAGAGRTLADLIAHWYATRSGASPEIGPQFEFNRFLRERRARHPGEPRAEAIEAWRAYRSCPLDSRRSLP